MAYLVQGTPNVGRLSRIRHNSHACAPARRRPPQRRSVHGLAITGLVIRKQSDRRGAYRHASRDKPILGLSV